MPKGALFGLLLTVFTLLSCSDNTVVDYFGEVDPNGWNYEDSVQCSFDISDTTHYYKLWANLKITGDFNRSHMQMHLTLVRPDGKRTEHPVRIKVADKTGKWLGSGMGDVLTYQVPVLNLQNFNHSGTYSVIIRQNFREDNWPNIQAAGIKITRDKEIF